MKNKIFKTLSLASALVLVACGNLSQVNDNGTTEKPNFPEIKEAQFNHDGTQKGSWVNWDNIKQVERGMNKDQLYNLIGRPHFAEGLYGVREWDYVFNYRENGQLKVCQYKVLFDKDMNVGEQWWKPNGCNSGFGRYELTADFLFDFDKDTLTAKGKQVVTDLANEIKSHGVTSIKLEGHTDRLGSDAYNQDLSQRRANTVKSFLVQEGITAPIEAVGLGEAYQVKACDGMTGQAEKDCLRPNRRVVVNTFGGKVEMQQSQSQEPGHDGPVKVKVHQDNQQKTSWKE